MTNVFDRIRCFRFYFDSKTLLVWCSRYASFTVPRDLLNANISSPSFDSNLPPSLIVFPLYSNCFFLLFDFFFQKSNAQQWPNQSDNMAPLQRPDQPPAGPQVPQHRPAAPAGAGQGSGQLLLPAVADRFRLSVLLRV